jgi:transcriptional regulator with XRE-family HTH domain
MVTSEQSRAARGWLNWTQEDLAKRANVSLSTIRDFEKGRRTPIGNNLDAIRRAFEDAGVVLVFQADRTAVGVNGPSVGPRQSAGSGF